MLGLRSACTPQREIEGSIPSQSLGADRNKNRSANCAQLGELSVLSYKRVTKHAGC